MMKMNLIQKHLVLYIYIYIYIDPQSYTMKELWGHPKNISSLPNSPSFSFGKDFTNQFTIRGGFKTPGVGFYERHEIRRSPAKSSSYATLNHTNYIYSGSNSKRQKSRGEEYQHTFEYTPEVRMIASDRKYLDIYIYINIYIYIYNLIGIMIQMIKE